MRPDSNQLNTKTQILNTAERLFATHGFAGTSLRHLAKEAGVNLAAVNYHFGSKEDLHGAVIGRMAKIITGHKLAALEELENLETEHSVETILRAYIDSGMAYILEDAELCVTRAQFIARTRTESASVQQREAEQFSASQVRFLALFQRALPEQSEAELVWKLDMVVTMLIRVLTETGHKGMLLKSATKEDLDYAVEELVKFSTAGIQAGSLRSS